MPTVIPSRCMELAAYRKLEVTSLASPKSDHQDASPIRIGTALKGNTTPKCLQDLAESLALH